MSKSKLRYTADVFWVCINTHSPRGQLRIWRVGARVCNNRDEEGAETSHIKYCSHRHCVVNRNKHSNGNSAAQ